MRVARKRGRTRWGSSDFVFDVSIRSPMAPLSDSEGPLSKAVLKINLELPETVWRPVADVDIEVPPEAVQRVFAEAERP